MDKPYIKHVVDKTMEMFPGYKMSDDDRDRIVKGFFSIEFDNPEKSPAAVQMIQSVVMVKMMLSMDSVDDLHE